MKKLAAGNKGVRDAEHYLPAFVLPILTGAASVILYGLTVQHRWHWIWVYVAYVLNAFSFSTMATASTLRITEAFSRWAAPAMVVVSGISYTTSFGIVQYPALDKSQGYSGANMEMACIFWVSAWLLFRLLFGERNYGNTLMGKGRLMRWGLCGRSDG
ncbi:hypothetical protein DL98DRAFT_597427 [Cadophora sp. DSE1049]|nr:hypothetical protein DL98DRAFT_597427 [Cadophora sp. DSE1049]